MTPLPSIPRMAPPEDWARPPPARSCFRTTQRQSNTATSGFSPNSSSSAEWRLQSPCGMSQSTLQLLLAVKDRAMEPNPNDEAESRKRLMMLMTRHQRQIFSYHYTLVPNRSDAEDLLQETSLVICEKFHEFEDGTDFVAWACQIAYWRVRCLQKLHQRDREMLTARYEPGGGVEEAARRSGRTIKTAYKALARLRKL